MTYQAPEEYRVSDLPGTPPESALTIAWSGTAAFTLEYKDTVLLIDPFVTRPRILSVPFLRQKVNEQLCTEVYPRADHVLLGHSHYDHLLDVPPIAIRTGAIVHGSKSTAVVCKACGVPDEQIDVVEHWKPVDCDAFKVTFAPSSHGKALFGRIPFPGEIEGELKPPLKAAQYKHGGPFVLLIEVGDFRIVQLGSADFIDEELEKIGPVDVLMPGISGRQKTPGFLKRLIDALQPKMLIPHHYDNFFSPLRNGLHLMPGVGIEDFFEEKQAACPDLPMLMPDFFQKIAFDVQTHKRWG